ncbi:MAG: acetylpolyamine amidohydrolase [Gammaproteobacteria bacterium]|nr:acetylpolyamine amidohydrolase [Gammaproteobacteria bacterium]HBF08228.1 acetylpolyamine amidohydrolase [Gammaproteobacteria bacterium]
MARMHMTTGTKAKKPIRTFYQEPTKSYSPPKEYNFGELIPHADSGSRASLIESLIKEHSSTYELMEPHLDPLPYLNKVHAPEYVEALEACSKKLQESEESNAWFFPSVFRVNQEFNRQHVQSNKHVGYYAFDTFTPVGEETFNQASRSAQSAVSAMDWMLNNNESFAYALCRPSGHHACHDYFGGYCFFNNAACAAERALETVKKVVILDVDYHHGNGTQSIYYDRKDVFVINVHADPAKVFPYFAGFEDEVGTGEGEGFNLNIIAEKDIQTHDYVEILENRVKPALLNFKPDVVIVSLGVDTAATDPLGDFGLTEDSFEAIGRFIKSINVPTVTVQEGGYDVASISKYVHAYMTGYLQGETA